MTILLRSHGRCFPVTCRRPCPSRLLQSSHPLSYGLWSLGIYIYISLGVGHSTISKIYFHVFLWASCQEICLSVFHSDTCEYQSPLRLLIKSRLFLTVLETDKFKLKGQTDRLSGKDPLCHRQHFLGGSSHGRGVSKFFQVSLVGHWTCLWGFLCYGSSILP